MSDADTVASLPFYLQREGKLVGLASFVILLMLRIGGIWRDVPASGVSEVLERVMAGDYPRGSRASARVTGAAIASQGRNQLGAGGQWFRAASLRRTRVTLGRGAGVVALRGLREALPLRRNLRPTAYR